MACEIKGFSKYLSSLSYLHFLQVVAVLRVIGVVLMLLFNALMWMLFTKSLQQCRSTVEATVLNSSANFCITVCAIYCACCWGNKLAVFTPQALCGYLLFGETLSLLWWTGASLIVLGVLLLTQDSSLHISQQKHHKQ